MPRKARVKSMSGIYHIMWRGANRQEIFHDDEDFHIFLDILQRYKEITKIKVYGWCLMSNHVHLLLREGDEEIWITMKRIGVSFVLYYNGKYQTIGPLFQGRFKSENVEDNRYLLTVIRYIHQNPLKAGMVDHVDAWRWSSCRDYYGMNRERRKLLDDDFILRRFGADRLSARESFKEFNERHNQDQCLEDEVLVRRLTDEEARKEIKKALNGIEIAQVKSLPKLKRDGVLRKTKEIKGLSQRQLSRILGVSRTIIAKV